MENEISFQIFFGNSPNFQSKNVRKIFLEQLIQYAVLISDA